MMNYALPLLLALLLVSCTAQEPAVNPDPNHTHADFAVFVDGTRFDFSQDKYMSTEEHPKHPHLHMHDGNGNVMHRHKPGLTIADFFQSIKVTMTEKCVSFDTGQQHWYLISASDHHVSRPGSPAPAAGDTLNPGRS